ncbi:hypothetical protein JTE90_012707 [Oedothorax gibbosus]|uniref:Uncharacterized protein n=1 Tax=Oedothorax gibbosus TaxID=931172 RepID=A0AAV6VYU1_9ARAC|nr:hypothetical protein JTE90_012707 [Oedothorax gibbosus]
MVRDECQYLTKRVLFESNKKFPPSLTRTSEKYNPSFSSPSLLLNSNSHLVKITKRSDTIANPGNPTTPRSILRGKIGVSKRDETVRPIGRRRDLLADNFHISELIVKVCQVFV